MLDVLLPQPLEDHLLGEQELVELEVRHLLGDGELEYVPLLVRVEGRIRPVELVLNHGGAELGAQTVRTGLLGLRGVLVSDHLFPEQNGVFQMYTYLRSGGRGG